MQKSQVQTASTRGPSPSKRLYSECRISADDSDAHSSDTTNSKILRQTALMFDARPFLSDLEEKSNQSVKGSKEKFGKRLLEITPALSDETITKLMYQYDYYFVCGYEKKRDKFKAWLLKSGEFEVPVKFSNSRSTSPSKCKEGSICEAEGSKTREEREFLGSRDADGRSNRVDHYKIMQLREESRHITEKLKSLQSAHNQSIASTDRKKMEYVELYASLCQHRVYSNALQTTAAFAERTENSWKHPSNNTSLKRRTSLTGLNPESRLTQVKEVHDAIQSLKEAIKTRQWLGTQLDGLYPLFPTLEGTPMPPAKPGRFLEAEVLCASRNASVNRSCLASEPSSIKPLLINEAPLFVLQSPQSPCQREGSRPLTQAESRAMALDMFNDLIDLEEGSS